ncbi:hypothetical protein [Paralysiella testudinis]|uniref:Uncharacterized protein n=1 Tax=Paralysiella testudinis TaxID=2809020 RepID=A0A892ZDD6_9NEIS|nr:hypothetical protein [Paralysiella testudinis]QRQ80952.1 hypothetical protein JQU52_09415 [Paralysiella testudinis]
MKPEEAKHLQKDTEIAKVINAANNGQTKQAEQAAKTWSKEAQKVNQEFKTQDKAIEQFDKEKSVDDSWGNIFNQEAIENANISHKKQHEAHTQVPEQQQINNKKDTMGIG